MGCERAFFVFPVLRLWKFQARSPVRSHYNVRECALQAAFLRIFRYSRVHKNPRCQIAELHQTFGIDRDSDPA
jgi:hypothetical protein